MSRGSFFTASPTRQPALSFLPQKNKTIYAHIKPGIYLFVQDKITKQVFLWNTNTGRGHHFLANRVNHEFNRPADEFSWIETAGEMVFGWELLGQCFCTGFFNSSLGLTEPLPGSPDYAEELVTYNDSIRLKRESSLLPVDRFFYVWEWEQQLFNAANRSLFFNPAGLLQKLNTEQLDQFRHQLGLMDQNGQYSEKVRVLFERLFITAGLRPAMAAVKASRQGFFGYYGECNQQEVPLPSTPHPNPPPQGGRGFLAGKRD